MPSSASSPRPTWPGYADCRRRGGADTIRRWEVSGPTPSATKVLRVLAMASERYPILEKFDIFDRHDVREEDRPAKRAAFREQMRDEARRRLG
ncbi:hypothetical protein ABIE89_000980 [Bradyrhizobium niftali]